MIEVCYQGPAGLSGLSFSVTAGKGIAPAVAALVEDVGNDDEANDNPGNYYAEFDDEDAPEGKIATVLLGTGPFDGGTIAKGALDLLFFMSQASATKSPVYPVSANAPSRINGTKLTAYIGEHGFSLEDISCFDANRDPLPLDGMNLQIVVRDKDLNLLKAFDPFTGSGSAFEFPLDRSCTDAEAIDGNAHYWGLLEVGSTYDQQDKQVGRLEVKKGARRVV